MRILIALLGAVTLWAEEKPATKPPVIPEAAKSAYWRTRAIATEARQAAERALAEQSKSEQALTSACGADAAPTLDQAGELSCAPKPKSAPESK